MRAIIRGVVIWGGAALVVGAFYWLDVAYGCGFFQRGGAALVGYTVIVGVFSLKERSEYADELHAIQLEQCRIAQEMYAEEHEARPDERIRLRRKIEPRLKELDARLERLVDAGGRFQELRIVEGPLLMLGTAVWGFGDLALRTSGCAL